MELIKMILMLACCIIFPICWGYCFWHIVSAICQIKEENGKVNTCKNALAYGWFWFLTGFCKFIILCRIKGYSIDRLSLAGLLLAATFTALFIGCLYWKSFRDRLVKELIGSMKRIINKENLSLLMVCVTGFFSISGLYLWQGMRLETYHTMPEDVSMILGTRFLVPKSNLAVLYAFFANIFGLRHEQVLFIVIPLIWLILLVSLLYAVISVLLERKRAQAVCMGVFFLLLLFGNSSHMTLPYMLLHAPYEKGAFAGGIGMLYLALCLFQLQKNIPKIVQVCLTVFMGLFCLVIL